ncbi:MAG TPA: hypothetical protein VJ650_06480 [Gemmatimonadaceae bacterium]|nr:hypothetical protein [Gemmatimonadaceae bacterium]
MVFLRALVPIVTLLACSPEANRVRDGGPGADPGNKVLVSATIPNPQVADTTLWPGLNRPPVDRLVRGEMPPPPGTTPFEKRDIQKTGTPASQSEQSTFDRSTTADPRQPSSQTDSSRKQPW